MLQGHRRTSPPPPFRVTLSHQYSVASFHTLRVLNCLHSLELRCSCCNVVRFCCDLETCDLVTATIVTETMKYEMPQRGRCLSTSWMITKLIKPAGFCWTTVLKLHCVKCIKLCYASFCLCFINCRHWKQYCRLHCNEVCKQLFFKAESMHIMKLPQYDNTTVQQNSGS
jgi:hypothetical protein